jgi:hypothetical protein
MRAWRPENRIIAFCGERVSQLLSFAMHGAWFVLLAGYCLSLFPFSELHASM